MRAGVGARCGLAVCVAATLLGEAAAPATVDIMPMLMELKFEPHHRNFVKNLYENQMLVRCNSIRWAGLHRVPRLVC